MFVVLEIGNGLEQKMTILYRNLAAIFFYFLYILILMIRGKNLYKVICTSLNIASLNDSYEENQPSQRNLPLPVL